MNNEQRMNMMEREITELKSALYNRSITENFITNLVSLVLNNLSVKMINFLPSRSASSAPINPSKEGQLVLYKDDSVTELRVNIGGTVYSIDTTTV